MRERIPNERIIEEAEYILAKKATVRQASMCFNRSKSAIHYDMRKHLPKIDKHLADRVFIVLETNTEERARRGGFATQAKKRGMQ